jgi:hypothetical protein
MNNILYFLSYSFYPRLIQTKETTKQVILHPGLGIWRKFSLLNNPNNSVYNLEVPSQTSAKPLVSEALRGVTLSLSTVIFCY